MTPSQIIALIRDAVIVAALGFVVWRVYSAGENAIKVDDIKALQAQLSDNAEKQAQWAKDSQDAQTQRAQDMVQVTAAINAQHAPIVLRSGPSSTCPVPRAPASPASIPPGTGSAQSAAGGDIRPEINRFELRLESVVADCRAALASWPK